VEEGHCWWWHPRRVSEPRSREKAILGEVGRRREDVILGDVGRRRDEAWLTREEAQLTREVVQ
jgi:hypothetical protein